MLKLDLSVPKPAEFIEFWTSPNNKDLLGCFWPTGSKISGNIGPVYPKGGFNPLYQRLTAYGLELIVNNQLRGSGGVSVPGHTSYLDGEDDKILGKVVGLCAKPIDSQIVLVDFDFPIFDCESARLHKLISAFTKAGAFFVQGNRKRLTVIMRQSDQLKEYFDEFHPGKSKVILGGATVGQQVEISFREGCSANIWGKHKSGLNYACRFPRNGQLGEMTMNAFQATIKVLDELGFNKKANARGEVSNRYYVNDVVKEHPAIAMDIAAMLRIIKRVQPDHKISVRSLLPRETIGAIEGRMCVSNGWRESPGYIPDGCRRLTTWYVMSDIVIICMILEELGIYFSKDEVRELIKIYATNVEYDRQLVPVVVEGYTTPQMVNKWAFDYIWAQYEEMLDRDDLSVAQSYAIPMLLKISGELNSVIRFINESVRNKLVNRTQAAA